MAGQLDRHLSSSHQLKELSCSPCACTHRVNNFSKPFRHRSGIIYDDSSQMIRVELVPAYSCL
ncbi:unnamed protein product [Mycena citricolor]|uniref:Uncharacterized protein n=1 Tax=Mycena citricolor TaxID=2018698 RepID=A0AAD2HF45_9AGAR|nr:unnamed protein product [Mycena citricolor]CAK5276523.1 unnamed protein product [Mycena citricolor]